MSSQRAKQLLSSDYMYTLLAQELMLGKSGKVKQNFPIVKKPFKPIVSTRFNTIYLKSRLIYLYHFWRKT